MNDEREQLVSAKSPVCRFGDEFDDQIFKQIDTFGVWILVVSVTVHHASQLFAEQAFSAGRRRAQLRIGQFFIFVLFSVANTLIIGVHGCSAVDSFLPRPLRSRPSRLLLYLLQPLHVRYDLSLLTKWNVYSAL